MLRAIKGFVINKMLAAIRSVLIQEIFPNLYAFYAKRKIQKQINELERGDAVASSVDEDLDLANVLNELQDYMDREDDRRKAIDDKAKSSLLVITISITVMLTGLSLIKEGKIYFKWPLLLIIVLGAIYFVLSAITSVQALNISRFYVLHPNDWIKEVYGTITDLKRIDKLLYLYNNLNLNERVLNIRSNFVSATLIGIRNGVILLFLAFAIALFNVGNQVQYLDSIDQKRNDTSPAALDSPEQNQPANLPSTSPTLPDNHQEPGSQNQVRPKSTSDTAKQQGLLSENQNVRAKKKPK